MFNKYLVRAYCVLGTILEAEDVAVSRIKVCPMELTFFWWEKTDNKQVSI